VFAAGGPADDPAGGRRKDHRALQHSRVLSEPNCGHYTAPREASSLLPDASHGTGSAQDHGQLPSAGATFTELTTPMYTPSVKRSLFERVPLKEIAEASWIAAGAVFLASDESRYMTGQHLTIDGGYVMDGSLPPPNTARSNRAALSRHQCSTSPRTTVFRAIHRLSFFAGMDPRKRQPGQCGFLPRRAAPWYAR